MSEADKNQSADTDWLTVAYDRHAARLYAYIMSVVRREDAAEDILQEVFCKLAARGALWQIRKPERYLFRAAHNEMRRWMRRSRRAHAGPPAEEQAAPTDEGDAGEPDAEAIERALAALPPEQAEVVHLKIHEGLTFAEIGRVVRCSVNTAASRYRYACGKLRRLLGGSSDER